MVSGQRKEPAALVLPVAAWSMIEGVGGHKGLRGLGFRDTLNPKPLNLLKWFGGLGSFSAKYPLS